MDVSAIAAAGSANAAGKVQAEASVRVLKMAMDMQAEAASQLLQALPPAATMPTTAALYDGAGRIVDTWV